MTFVPSSRLAVGKPGRTTIIFTVNGPWATSPLFTQSGPGDVCVLDVASDVATDAVSGGALPQTGSSFGVTGLLVAVALIALGVLAVTLTRRRRRLPLAALALLLGVSTAAALSIGTAPSASAAPATDCVLLSIDDIERQAAANLLPGESAEPLSYRITNVTEFPIEVTVTTAHDDADAAAWFGAQITSAASDPLAEGVFADLEATRTVTLAAGDSLPIAYRLTLSAEAGNAAQDLALTFISTITATGP